MAKTKSPLLSFDARGTIGEALTLQKRGSNTIIREKPIPTDPYSLAQAYQRWDYRDYAYQWNTLSLSEREAYRSAASRLGLTIYAYYMRLQLQTLPDLLARWRLDNVIGGVTPDSSKQSKNATVYGATPSPGFISNSLLFDGLNDWCECGTVFQDATKSVECLVKPMSTHAVTGVIISAGSGATAGYGFLYTLLNSKFTVSEGRGSGGLYLPQVGTYTVGQLYHLIVTYDKPTTTLSLYINGALNNSASGGLHGAYTAVTTQLGRYGAGASSYLSGYLDNVILYNRVLDSLEIPRHSERRYP